MTAARNRQNYETWRQRYEIATAHGVKALDESACIRSHIDRVTSESRSKHIG